MSGLKDMFHALDQFVILPRSAVSKEAAACRSEGRQMVRQRVESSQKRYRGFSNRIGEIVDENQKKNKAQNAALRNYSLDRKRV